MEGRLALLNINLKDVAKADDCDLDKVAEITEGYSCADITTVCRYYMSTLHMNTGVNFYYVADVKVKAFLQSLMVLAENKYTHTPC